MKMDDSILGKKCRDRVSGFTGVAVSTHHYLHGCTRVSVQPAIDKDGKLPEAQAFDLPSLEVLEEAVERGSTKTGGPDKYPDVRRY